jgi:hypothetical protein
MMTPWPKSLRPNPPKLRKRKEISIKITKPGQSFNRSGFVHRLDIEPSLWMTGRRRVVEVLKTQKIPHL